MENEEAIRPVCTIAVVQGAHAVQGGLQKSLVFRHVFGRRVGEVGQQCEPQMRVGVGKRMHFEPLQQGGGASRPDQQRRHDHDGRAVFRNAVLEL